MLISLFTFHPLFIPRLKPILHFVHYAHPGPIFYFYTIFFFICVGAGFFVLILHLQKISIDEKNKLKLLIIATSIGFVGGGLTFLPVYDIPCPQYGLFVMPLYPFSIAYLIGRKSFLDPQTLVETAHTNKLSDLGIIAASLSHELRSPINMIRTYAAKCIEGNAVSEEQREAALTIQKQADRAFNISQRLIGFARKRKQDEPIIKPVELSTLVDQLKTLIQFELYSNNIELHCDFPPEASTLHGDEGYLEEVLFNLTVNASQALKKIEATSKRIHLSSVKTNETFELTVEDNGPGMDAYTLKTIFEPFHTTRSEGLGLGLYITKQLVEKMGAKISVTSILGQGTTFKLTFKR